MAAPPRYGEDMDAIDHASRLAADAVYFTVGMGLLGVNRVQVRRRELERDLQRTARDVHHEATQLLAHTPLAEPLRLLGKPLRRQS